MTPVAASSARLSPARAASAWAWANPQSASTLARPAHSPGHGSGHLRRHRRAPPPAHDTQAPASVRPDQPPPAEPGNDPLTVPETARLPAHPTPPTPPGTGWNGGAVTRPVSLVPQANPARPRRQDYPGQLTNGYCCRLPEPMIVAENPEKRSHDRGRRHPQLPSQRALHIRVSLRSCTRRRRCVYRSEASHGLARKPRETAV
jgi:hypothetical protein